MAEEKDDDSVLESALAPVLENPELAGIVGPALMGFTDRDLGDIDASLFGEKAAGEYLEEAIALQEGATPPPLPGGGLSYEEYVAEKEAWEKRNARRERVEKGGRMPTALAIEPAERVDPGFRAQVEASGAFQFASDSSNWTDLRSIIDHTEGYTKQLPTLVDGFVTVLNNEYMPGLVWSDTSENINEIIDGVRASVNDLQAVSALATEAIELRENLARFTKEHGPEVAQIPVDPSLGQRIQATEAAAREGFVDAITALESRIDAFHWEAFDLHQSLGNYTEDARFPRDVAEQLDKLEEILEAIAKSSQAMGIVSNKFVETKGAGLAKLQIGGQEMDDATRIALEKIYTDENVRLPRIERRPRDFAAGAEEPPLEEQAALDAERAEANRFQEWDAYLGRDAPEELPVWPEYSVTTRDGTILAAFDDEDDALELADEIHDFVVDRYPGYPYAESVAVLDQHEYDRMFGYEPRRDAAITDPNVVDDKWVKHIEEGGLPALERGHALGAPEVIHVPGDPDERYTGPREKTLSRAESELFATFWNNAADREEMLNAGLILSEDGKTLHINNAEEAIEFIEGTSRGYRPDFNEPGLPSSFLHSDGFVNTNIAPVKLKSMEEVASFGFDAPDAGGDLPEGWVRGDPDQVFFTADPERGEILLFDSREQARLGAGPKGMLMLAPHYPETDVGGLPERWVQDVEIVPELRGQGFGSDMYDAAIDMLKQQHPEGFKFIPASSSTDMNPLWGAEGWAERGGATSEDAERVWGSLKKKFPTDGTGIYIGPPDRRPAHFELPTPAARQQRVVEQTKELLERGLITEAQRNQLIRESGFWSGEREAHAISGEIDIVGDRVWVDDDGRRIVAARLQGSDEVKIFMTSSGTSQSPGQLGFTGEGNWFETHGLTMSRGLYYIKASELKRPMPGSSEEKIAGLLQGAEGQGRLQPTHRLGLGASLTREALDSAAEFNEWVMGVTGQKSLAVTTSYGEIYDLVDRARADDIADALGLPSRAETALAPRAEGTLAARPEPVTVKQPTAVAPFQAARSAAGELGETIEMVAQPRFGRQPASGPKSFRPQTPVDRLVDTLHDVERTRGRGLIPASYEGKAAQAVARVQDVAPELTLDRRGTALVDDIRAKFMEATNLSIEGKEAEALALRQEGQKSAQALQRRIGWRRAGRVLGAVLTAADIAHLGYRVGTEGVIEGYQSYGADIGGGLTAILKGPKAVLDWTTPKGADQPFGFEQPSLMEQTPFYKATEELADIGSGLQSLFGARRSEQARDENRERWQEWHDLAVSLGIEERVPEGVGEGMSGNLGWSKAAYRGEIDPLASPEYQEAIQRRQQRAAELAGKAERGLKKFGVTEEGVDWRQAASQLGETIGIGVAPEEQQEAARQKREAFTRRRTRAKEAGAGGLGSLLAGLGAQPQERK